MAAPAPKRPQIFKDVTLDVAEKALVISYSTDVGNGEFTHHKKKIRLKAIDASTDVSGLADAILASADIIPAAKKGHVVGLLSQLKPGGGAAASSGPAATASSTAAALDSTSSTGSTSATPTSSSTSSTSSSTGALPPKGRSERAESKEEPSLPPEEEHDWDDPTAKLDDVESYLEKLYDLDLAVKTEGARKLVALAQHSKNLVALCNNVSLMTALARVLRDEYKKSVELTTTLVQIFFCISHWKDLHPTCITARVGDMCMRIVELEHGRHAARMADLGRFERLGAMQAAGDGAGEAAFRKSDASERAKEEAAESEAKSAAEKKASSAGAASAQTGGGEDDGGEGGAGASSSSSSSNPAAPSAPTRKIKLRPLPPGKVEVDKERRKAHLATRRSEGLIWVCIHTLIHLAEDLDIERKMCKRGIVQLILPLLAKGRENTRLQLLTINFLRKLSIFEENKNAMVALGAGPLLVALLPEPEEGRGGKGSKRAAATGAAAVAVAGGGAGASPSPPLPPPPSPLLTELRASVLHLMFNLTFDPTMCASFLHCGTIPRAGSMLRLSPFRLPGLKLLYRLSTDYGVRGQFAATEAVSLTLSMVLKFPTPRLPPELAALAANLTMHPLTAEAVLQTPDAVKKLCGRLIKTGDAAVAKLLRGLSQYTYSLAADSELRAAAEEEVGAMDPRLAAALGLVRLGKPTGSKGAKGRAAAAQAAVARAEKAKAAAGGEGKVGDAAEEEALLAAGGGEGGSRRRARSGSGNGRGKGEPGEPPMITDELDGGILGGAYGGGEEAPPFMAGFSPLVGSWRAPPPHPVAFTTAHDGLWTPCVPDLLHMLSLSESQDIVDVSVEILGLLANLLPRDIPGGSWSGLLGSAARGEGGLMHTLSQRLIPREDTDSEDDLLLESVMLLGSMALDSAAAPPLAASSLPKALIHVIRARGLRDGDLCLQALVTLNRLLCHEETREVLVSDPHLSGTIIVLMGHPFPGIAAEAEDAAYVVGEYDREFGDGLLWEEFRARRFAVHNDTWCRAVAKAAGAVVKSHPGGMEGAGSTAASNASNASSSSTAASSASSAASTPLPLTAAAQAAKVATDRIRGKLIEEARQGGQKGPHYWLPGGEERVKFAIVTVDYGEDVDPDVEEEDVVEGGMEEDMLNHNAASGKSSGGGSRGGGGVLSPGRGGESGTGGGTAASSTTSPYRTPGVETSAPFDMDYLWQQAQSVGNAFGESRGGGVLPGGSSQSQALRITQDSKGEDASGALSGVPAGSGDIDNNPVDYGEEVENLGDHEDSGDMVGEWGSEAGGTDVEDEMKAFLNPYGGR